MGSLTALLCLLVALADPTMAQTSESFNLFSSLLSDAGSIFTLVTSALGPNTSSASSTSASTTGSDASATSSSSTASSTASSTSTTGSSSADSSASPSLTTGPSSTNSASSSTTTSAQAASTTGASESHGGGSNTLAIVLGCTLGALALAAFLALLYLCIRKRRRSAAAASAHRPVSTTDSEIESWRHEKPRVRSFKSPVHHTISETNSDGTPLMTQRDQTSMHPDYQNPFVPAPPPARRSSRHDLESVPYSAHPYSPDDVNRQGNHGFGPDNWASQNHHGDAIAAGLGGAALGGLAAHAKDRHDRKRSLSRDKAERMHGYSEAEGNTMPQIVGDNHNIGNTHTANAKEPWPYGASRRSNDSARSYRHSFSRSQENFVTPNQHPWENEAMPSDAGILAGAGVGAAAATAHHNRARSGQRKGILKQTDSDNSASNTSSGRYSAQRDYADAPAAHNTGPHELASADIPEVSRNSLERPGRPKSLLGDAAPVAAIGAVAATRRSSDGRSLSSQRRRRRSDPRSGDGAPSLPLTPGQTVTGERGLTSGHPDPPVSDVNRLSRDTDRGLPALAVSPSPGDQHLDTNELRSPVSPITNSNPGTWSKSQAEELGLLDASEQRLTSQESTVVNSSSSPDKDLSDSSDQSSGLVSAIQKVFNSQKASWTDDGAMSSDQRQGYQPVDNQLSSTASYRNVPRRKPAAMDLMPHESTMPQTASFVDPNPSDRRSIDSSRSLPPKYRSRANSGRGGVQTTDFAPTTSEPDSTRHRATSRPGYGIGSGDPFDLARVRTDSSMTGVSLSHYQEPARPRSVNERTSAGSQDYREPTLAELRHQVQSEDRDRARKSWERAHRKSGSSGLRYGDDRELFNLVDQTTGFGGYDDDSDRFYAKQRPNSRGVGRAM